MTTIYAGIHASRRSEIPPGLPLWSGNCDRCHAPIVCHAPGLKRWRKRLQGLGEDSAVVCPDCATLQLESHGGIEFMEITKEVEKHFLRG